MNNQTVLLILLFIIKVILFLVIPIFLIFTRKVDNKFNRYLSIYDIVGILIFIALLIFNYDFSKNISISGIRNNIKINNNSVYIYEPKRNNAEEVTTETIYTTNKDRKVFYFNNNNSQLGNLKILCNNKPMYFKHFGNSISAISTLISTYQGTSLNPVDILKLSYENDIIDCDDGIDIDDLINVINKNYSTKIKEIDSSGIDSYLYDGNIVLAEVEYNQLIENNLTCSKSYVIIYKVYGDYYKIINPNNYDYDYICPDNTPGSLSVIKANINGEDFSKSDLLKLGLRYYVTEVR